MRLKKILLQTPLLLTLAWMPATAPSAPKENVHEAKAEGNKIVKKAQKKLHKQGYYEGEIDGLNGSETSKAVSEFQRTKGIAVTGRLDVATLDALDIDYDPERDGDLNEGPLEEAAEATEEGVKKAASVTEKGVRAGGEATGKGLKKAGEAVEDAFDKDEKVPAESDGDDTLKAQNKLAGLGYYDGKADGMMGPETEEAIRQFQKKKNLPVTGRLDERTRDELDID